MLCIHYTPVYPLAALVDFDLRVNVTFFPSNTTRLPNQTFANLNKDIRQNIETYVKPFCNNLMFYTPLVSR